MPLEAVTVYGQGARLIREGAGIVYRKWVDAPKGLRPGELVVIESSTGEILGCAFYDTVGPVALRVIWYHACPFREPREAIENLLEGAMRVREKMGFRVGEGLGFRLVHSDGDMMPGLIIDAYDDLAVIQSSSIVWDVHLETIVSVLARLGFKHVYEKSTQRTRRDIGLEPRERLLYGFETRKVIREGIARFVVDVREGQKTGFFLDQRPNRLDVEKYAAGASKLLDLFSYTGGFGIHALLAGARKVVFVDEDERALRLLRENLRINNIEESRVEILNRNVWDVLRRVKRDEYDVVIADPPAFIPSPQHRDRGLTGYQRLFARVFHAASSVAFLSSCSTFLTRQEFLEVIGKAAARSEKVYRLLGDVRGVPEDHPYRVHAEHLNYLKAVFIGING